jgi:hypothetical protein
MMENPDRIEIIARDPARGKLLLVMTEHRPWDGEPMRQQFLAKANAYAGYVLSEQFTRDRPGLNPEDVVIKLDCAEPPDPETVAFYQEVAEGLRRYCIGFEYEVC